jgi:hypothetical protein
VWEKGRVRSCQLRLDAHIYLCFPWAIHASNSPATPILRTHASRGYPTHTPILPNDRVRPEFHQHLARGARAVELRERHVLPAAERQPALADIEENVLVHQHLPQVAGRVAVRILAVGARVQVAAVPVELAVILDHELEVFEHVLAQVAFLRLLDNQAQGGVQRVGKQNPSRSPLSATQRCRSSVMVRISDFVRVE